MELTATAARPSLARTYLPKATDFTDLPILAKPTKYPARPGVEMAICPTCHGHGGWNLRLNCYPHSEYRHLKTDCAQCRGYGWINPEDACEHKMHEITPAEARNRGFVHMGRCHHVEICETCGTIRDDSTDD